MPEILNKDLWPVAEALREIGDQKPKRGLFGFKYLTAEAVIRPLANIIGASLNELLERHTEKDNEGNMIQIQPGMFKLADPTLYEKEQTELMEQKSTISSWPPVVFVPEDIERAEIEISLRNYVRLAPLLQQPGGG